MLALTFLVATLCACRALGQTNGYQPAHPPWKYRDAFQRFMDNFVHANETLQIIQETGSAPALADDCVGRVDLTNNFDGLQLNEEYLYGLFTNLASLPTTQVIGNPTDYRVQSLAIEGPVVSASVIIASQYPTINYTLPIQVDLWFIFNDDLKVTSYDATFRRYPQAFNYVLPMLGPQIAKELNVTYDPANLQQLVAQRVITDTCTLTQQYCLGNNTQYDSLQSCASFMATQIPFGQIWEAGQNTTICRYVHKNMLALRPDVHCPHVGPSGGDMCIPRDYEGIVNGYPFSSTLIAPNVTGFQEAICDE